MYAEERRAYILAALEKRGTVHSYELAEQMGVSRETIRRDIMELSNRGPAGKDARRSYFHRQWRSAAGNAV